MTFIIIYVMGELLTNVVKFASQSFDNVLVMPNIKPPVKKVQDANEYLKRIKKAFSGANIDNQMPNFLMTLYLTDNTTPEDIQEVYKSENVFALKLYPAGATTNSEFGVTNYKNIDPVLKEMASLEILSSFTAK